MPAAERSEIAQASLPALVIGHGVILVALCGRAPAPREDAGVMPGLDQVPECPGRLVRRRLPGVIAGIARKQRDGKGPAITVAAGLGSGTGPGSASRRRLVTMTALLRRPVPCTTVGDRAALRVGEGEAPSVAGAAVQTINLKTGVDEATGLSVA